MPSSVDLVNLALDRLGQQPISSLSQTTGNGPLALSTYDHERRTLLNETHWTFARSEITLDLLSTNNWQNWSFAYSYPPDCIRIHYIMNPNLVQSYIGYPYNPAIENFFCRNCPHDVTQALDQNGNQTGQKVILTNMEDAILVYTKDTTDIALFPEPFQDVLILKMAKSFCHKLLPNSPILSDIKQELAMVSSMAKGTSSNESVEHEALESDFQRCRI